MHPIAPNIGNLLATRKSLVAQRTRRISVFCGRDGIRKRKKRNDTGIFFTWVTHCSGDLCPYLRKPSSSAWQRQAMHAGRCGSVGGAVGLGCGLPSIKRFSPPEKSRQWRNSICRQLNRRGWFPLRDGLRDSTADPRMACGRLIKPPYLSVND